MSEISDFFGYENKSPVHQNAIDLFGGSWVSKFPPISGLSAGIAAHFDDVRVTWAASAMGGLSGRSILELGPLEAYNSLQFQTAGASSVVAIEANRINFLKCLIVKNIFNLSATFLLGDFLPYMVETQQRFDVVWASGLLYHSTTPVELLIAQRRVADIAFIWTQYYEDAVLEGVNAPFFDGARDKTVEFSERRITLHHRNYMESAGISFSGGQNEHSYWMTRSDIMFILDKLGYHTIVMGFDNPSHPAGPAMFFLADARNQESANFTPLLEAGVS